MKKLISFIAVAGVACSLFAELNLKNLVNAKYYDELLSNGQVTVVHDDEKDAGTGNGQSHEGRVPYRLV